MIVPHSPREHNKGNNKKSQALSALLSASALGVFLEGCGGGARNDGTSPPPSVSVTGTGLHLAVASAEGFTGDEASNTVSYAGAEGTGEGGTEGVTVDLQTPANNRGSFAEGDTYENIENIQGSAHADSIRGDSQANTLGGGAGADTLHGGEGEDTASYEFASEGVRIDLSRTEAQIDFDGDDANNNEAIGDILISIEHIVGSPHADTLTGNDQDNILSGGAGADRLTGGEGEDTASYKFASEGVRVNLYETPVQTDFETNSYGFAANNNEAVGDILTEIQHIIGSDHNDWLTGDDGGKTLQGGAGNDRLEAGGYEGEDGNARFNGGTGADTLIGGDDDDTALYTDSDKGVRIDISRTDAQIDFDGSHGFSANNNEAIGDILFSIEQVEGSDHDDWLIGEGGNSILQGGKGNDRLEGGSGTDTFLFNEGDGTDTIIDDPRGRFSGGAIVFLHGADNNGYDENTIYTLTRPDPSGEAVTLTVTNNGITLNIIKFATDPTDDTYGFIFRTIDGTNTFDMGNTYTSRISDLVAPPRLGSEENPLLATAAADSFVGALGYDWVSYADSTDTAGVAAGVSVALDDNANPAVVSKGWAEGDTLTNFNNVIGSAADDILTGNDQDNTLSGGAGADTLTGGEGADTLTGGDGTDTASYELASEGVRVDLSFATGTAQTDFEANHGFSANTNEAVGDILTDIERILGSAHNDWLTGDNDGNDLQGGGGDDRLEGGAGEDILYGGADADDIFGSDGNDRLFGDTGNDRLYGDRGNDRLEGGAGMDTLNGGVGNDELYGGEGDDTLEGDAGTDIMDGGAGMDTAFFEYVGGGVRVDLSLTSAQIDFDGTHGFQVSTSNPNDAAGDTITNIEHILGSNFNDWFTGNDENNDLQGGRGDDRLQGGEGEDTYLFGTGHGTDTLADNGGNIVFLQGTNNDYTGAIYTFTRADIGDGEAATLTVSKDGNTLNVLEFTSDTSIDLTSDYTFYTRDTDGIDRAIASSSFVVPPKIGSQNNPFMATDAADSFTGSFVGSIGYNWVSYAGSTDTAGVAAGVSVELGTSTTPATVSEAWAEGDTLTNFNNVIGSEADDTLVGNDQDNTLSGGAGADTLTGGEGADTLTGGEGADTASYEFASEGVRVDLSLTTGTAQTDFAANHGFSANTNEAVGDILSEIQHITGSDHNDWLTGDDTSNDLQGGGGDDRLQGGAGEDSYLFNTGDGTDTIVDNGGKIVFLQGTNNDYTGATYTFARANSGNSEAVILTVTKNGNILNVLEFASNPTSNYTFSTRDTAGIDSAIDSSSLVVPPRSGSEANPFLATDAVDIFPGSFVGSIGYNWVSYENSADTAGNAAGVSVELGDNANPAVVSKGWASGDRLTNINNVIGSEADDTLVGNSAANILSGGVGADTLTGGRNDDTVLYRNADEGVRVDLSLTTQIDFDGSYGFNANNNEAVGDTIADIEHITGSNFNDWLTGDSYSNHFDGGKGNDRLEGGAGGDFYGFRTGDGTDTIVDDGGNIFFLQETNNDYTGAAYTFTRANFGNSEAVTLTVTKDGNILNVLEFTSDPSNYAFYKVTGSSFDVLPPESLVVPPRVGSESNPFVATDAVDIFPGSTGYDWASYENSEEGVRIALDDNANPATVSEGWAAGDSLTNINNVIGSGDIDVLIGNSAANILSGGVGADTLTGGEGADTLSGGAGADTASYEFASEGVRVDLSLTTQIDFDGADANNNEAVGDILTEIEHILGSASNDWLTGDNGNNNLQGGGGDDRLQGGAGADTLTGGEGSDTALYGDADEGVRVDLSLTTGTAQTDFAANHGFSANTNEAVGDTLTEIQHIVGSDHNDWLTGDSHDNHFGGGKGNDRLEGGAGEDTYAFRTGDGTDTIVDDGGYIVFLPRENDDYTGAAYTFTRANFGNSEAITLTVSKDGNTLNVLEFASDPSNYAFYKVTGNSFDMIPPESLVVPPRSGSEANPFLATDAVDIFPGSFVGSTGYDWASYENSEEGVRIALDDNANPAVVSEGWAAGDRLTNINNVIGSAAGDILAGNDKDNILSGGVGADTLTGGEGADTLSGGAGADTASYEFASEGVRVDLSLTTQIDFETNHGFSANNNEAVGDILTDIEHILGSASNDWLTGDNGNNNLQGGGGDDRLEGGAGADTLSGGAGADTVLYRDADEGVRVDLSRTSAQIDFDGADANNNEAVGDTLTEIQHIVGSNFNDWLTGDSYDNHFGGGKGNDRLEGGAGEDSYLFNTGDGTDTLVDNGGKIVFLQGTNNDYVGAAYTFSRPNFGNSETVILTVTKNGNILNVLEFASDPTSDYTFSTRDTAGIDSEIDSSLFVVPPRLGSEQNPFVATDAADIFPGSTGYDWASYEGSERGVRIALDDNANPAVVSDGWAVGDRLTNINNVIGSDYRDTLVGNSDANIIYGGGGVNSLYGGAGADTLYGGDGIDRLEGGTGADTLDGGGGSNYASYFDSDRGVRVDLTLTGAQQDFDGVDANNNEAVGDIFIRIGHIRGSDHDDWLTGNAEQNEFYARGGNDRISGGAGEDYLSGGADADFMDGGLGRDTAGYREASRAVRVNLLLQGQQQKDFDGADANNNDAVGDTLTNIENILGSNYNDLLTGDGASNSITGDGGDDLMRGGGGVDTYVFASGDGTDRIDDNGGNIVFEQGAGSNYRGATYAFVRENGGRGEAVTLTVVDSGGNTLNVIAFASDPLPNYNFYTRIGKTDIDIHPSSLVVPPRQNSQGSPPLPAESIGNSDTYIFEAGDGKQIIRGGGDGLGNNLIFRAPSGEAYADADFQSNRGFLGDDLVLSEANDGNDLEIVVSLEGIETNRVIVQGYFSTGDDESYTIYRNALSEDTIVSDILAETS